MVNLSVRVGRISQSYVKNIADGAGGTDAVTPVLTPDSAVYDRLDRGFGYSTTEAAQRTGIARHGLTTSDLTVYTGSTSIPSGTRLYRQWITFAIDVSAGDIEIEQCLIRPTTYPGGAPAVRGINMSTFTAPPARVSVIDTEISGEGLSGASQQGWMLGVDGMVDVIGCDIHHTGSGIAVRNAGPAASRAWDVDILSNYIHDQISTGDPATTGNHVDGFTIRDFEAGAGRHVNVEDNWIDAETANSSGACFLQAWPPGIYGATFRRNLFQGGAQVIGIEEHTSAYGSLLFDDNRIVGSNSYIGYYNGGAPAWTNNYLYNASNAPTYAGIAANVGAA